MTEETKETEKPKYRGETRVVMTPEMVQAGIKAAWTAENPPQIVEDQVRKIYLAMEAEKFRQGAG
ncbi:hypothetical protein [Mesorhizobium sp.]|uniref:hypothetical protein n=1 Tax=Mesorhizobium sp. TaxID=1871066 RepID=UPI000FE6DEDC|nr:hypothetical protein [Mesorhizobium sp.]RWI93429.1 MAG: hypothetical protein EOR22_15355 [Mesorhizobium sp.]TIQ05835.1 MAG: hypothetical protein E5X50_20335 [Mesorhizobium sp.]TIR18345.1 MAG: hypothetical protein E5X33_22995 [Mesorhizobium sp.]